MRQEEIKRLQKKSWAAILVGMTLPQLFAHYGITQHHLVTRLSLKRQYAHMLWTGQRRLGHRLGKRIADEFGIPIQQLLYPEETSLPVRV